MQAANRLTVAQAALRLGLSYHAVRNRLFAGALKGGCDSFGRYYIDGDEVDRLVAEREAAAHSNRKGKTPRGGPDAAA